MTQRPPRWTITRGETVDGHVGILSRPAFAPDGRHFAIGDGGGALVVRTRKGDLVRSSQSPPNRFGKALIRYVRWSSDGKLIATMENYVLRVRRADDLSVVAERDSQFGPIAFTEQGELLLGTRSLVVFDAMTLQERASFPIERRPLEQFDIETIFVMPGTTLAVVCDAGGRSSDEDDRTTDRDAPQITVFDVTTGAIVKVLEDGVRTDEGLFDPWRDHMCTVSYELGTSFFTSSFDLVRRWQPYASRAEAPSFDGPPRRPYIPYAKALGVCEPYLATLPDMDALTQRTIDLWHPTTLAHLASIDLPEGERPRWVALSPDGGLMITPTKEPGDRGPHPFRTWTVTPPA